MNIVCFLLVMGCAFIFVSCAQRERKKIPESKVLNANMLNNPDLKNLGKFEMIYIVKDGDDIYKIAKILDTTAKWIIKRNFITSDVDIYPGRELIVPTP